MMEKDLNAPLTDEEVDYAIRHVEGLMKEIGEGNLAGRVPEIMVIAYKMARQIKYGGQQMMTVKPKENPWMDPPAGIRPRLMQEVKSDD